MIEDRAGLLALLQGEGIEIGALQIPSHVPHLKVHYVDCRTRAELREHYPELKDFDFVEAGIIDDAETLATLQDDSQDFVIANHVIEHMANPIAALHSWGRVVRPGGRIFLAVPDKHETFDRERPLTPLSHLVEDYRKPSPERDFEHFREYSREVCCKTFNARPVEQSDEFARELWEKKYSIHFHVWDYSTFSAFMEYFVQNFPASRLKVLEQRGTIGNEFIFVLEKH